MVFDFVTDQMKIITSLKLNIFKQKRNSYFPLYHPLTPAEDTEIKVPDVCVVERLDSRRGISPSLRGPSRTKHFDWQLTACLICITLKVELGEGEKIRNFLFNLSEFFQELDLWLSNFHMHQIQLQGLLKHRLSGSNPGASGSGDLGWGPGICLSKKLPVNTDAAGLGTAFREPMS